MWAAGACYGTHDCLPQLLPLETGTVHNGALWEDHDGCFRVMDRWLRRDGWYAKVSVKLTYHTQWFMLKPRRANKYQLEA